MRTFVFSDDKSYKFWNIELSGGSFTVTYGKVGGKGQTKTKEFADAGEALREHDKLVAEKLRKGYVETTPAPASTTAATPLLAAFEDELVEKPDDLATHAARADYLMEQDDPRGEFAQVQLSLEDPSQPTAERTKLRRREGELLDRHVREWLGDMGRFLVGEWSGPDKPYHYQFARGWLDLVRVLPFPDAFFGSLARSPEARLLRRFEVVYDMRYHPFDFDEFTEGPIRALRSEERANETYDAANILPPLIESPYLTNLRAFKLGFSDDEDTLTYSTMVGPFGACNAQQVLDLLRKNRRMEELHLNADLGGVDQLFASAELGNLRLLQYYYGTDDYNASGSGYPLAILADNRSLQRLTTLKLHPGRDTTIALQEMEALLRSPNLPNLTHLQIHRTTFGNEACPVIIDSGILKRLQVLDIGYGNMTDEGARLLADCPDLKHLRRLDVSRNSLTPQGVALLEATGVEIIADTQHDLDDDEWLYEVDVE